MEITNLLDRFGDAQVLAAGAAVLGFAFGFFGQQSRFCLRAAVIEFWHHRFGERLAVWLLAFSTAVLCVQAMQLVHWLDVGNARQLAVRGSLSGALIGGILFGAGMIMTRGCASRLLILSANGNLRALLSGLVFAVAAQAASSGVLAPLRLTISEWWTIDGGPRRNLLSWLHAGPVVGTLLGLAWLLIAIYYARRSPTMKPKTWIGAVLSGLAVALAWWYTYFLSTHSFEAIQVRGLTFSGPSAEWLMRVLNTPSAPIGFDYGMLPGVFAGSLLAALWAREFKLEVFDQQYRMPRYIIGAILMGFGAMLAGGCAVGAGMTGGSIFALTAWLTLLGMWGGAGVADKWLDSPSLAQQLFNEPRKPAPAP